MTPKLKLFQNIPMVPINIIYFLVHMEKHTSDEFPNMLKNSFGVYLILPLMIIFLRNTYALLYEKEKKLREGMKMMGLSNTSFYLSWIITYFIIYTIISIIATVLLSILKYFVF